MNPFVETIEGRAPEVRDRPLAALLAGRSTAELLAQVDELEAFRRATDNLYHRVRAALFLHVIHRDHVAEARDVRPTGHVPHAAQLDFLERRFESAIDRLRRALAARGPDGALASALAHAYHQAAFQTLTDQVRRSVRASRGNQWMFRIGHAADHPVRIHPALLERAPGDVGYPVLEETTPVRLDLSHSGWSDIFFLGMDHPEGARVLNLSVGLAVRGRDRAVAPPIQTWVRVIDEPLLRLTSLDLQETKDLRELQDLFDFGNDHLSLLKAGVIASGVVPSAFEGSGQRIERVLAQVLGPGLGLELVTRVNDIPKGSRLAVSTNLLGSIVTLLMRATRQTRRLTGTLEEDERRLVCSRAILGEWLGGSGGGWQDSGGIWPAIKVIEGVAATEEDPEFGVSRGCLLPRHRVLEGDAVHPELHERLERSLVLFHGGMAQNVGPILELVTQKYLLRSAAEWRGRLATRSLFDGILTALRAGDVPALARATTANWEGPLQTILPWVTNQFTETVIQRARAAFGADYWGFLMLGGMSGGGMGMFANPERRAAFQDGLLEILMATKRELERALPFAMDPVVYEFAIDPQGTRAVLHRGDDAFLPAPYYALVLPRLARDEPQRIAPSRRREMLAVTARTANQTVQGAWLHDVLGNLFQVGVTATRTERARWTEELERLKRDHGFDPLQHEAIRAQLRSGRIGIPHNRLPIETVLEDARDEDVVPLDAAERERGSASLRAGRVAVLTLAAGVGTRWTQGAGVVKAIHPFCAFQGRHRSFLEVRVAQTRRAMREHGTVIPHVIATSFLTHDAIRHSLERHDAFGGDVPLHLSPGRSIGQRFVPMARDLRALWEETREERLDAEKQKVREAVRHALMDWARARGEGVDYVDNLPLQCLHPTGHWYEVPNLFRNGVLARLLRERPQLETLLLHNVDTLGADLDPDALGHHLARGAALTFEVTPRRFEDRGGGLARVHGRPRLVEGLALPREEDELALRYYNTNTTWIQIDPLLEAFQLTRADLESDPARVDERVRTLAARMPTYVTIKDVKLRWGHGQEDVYPVAQFEKIWGDLSALPDLPCTFLAVPRRRGQQLKSPSQLDPWRVDGSRDEVEGSCVFG